MPAEGKKKEKKAKKKTPKSEMGGSGEHKDKTYEELIKKHMDYVNSLIRGTDQNISAEEDEFVDWVLNTKEGRELYQKFKNGPGCMASCVIQ